MNKFPGLSSYRRNLLTTENFLHFIFWLMSYIIKYLFHKYTHTQTHPLSQTLYMMIVNTILKMKITASFAIQLDFKKKYTLTPPPPKKRGLNHVKHWRIWSNQAKSCEIYFKAWIVRWNNANVWQFLHNNYHEMILIMM